MSILKRQVNSSSNFTSFFIAMTNNSPVSFQLTHFLTLDKRIPSKSKFRDFQVLWCKFSKSLMSILKVQISFPSNFASIFSVIKHNFSTLFLAQTLYTLVKSNLLKCKCLRFSSTRVKICQIPHVNFELTNQFLFKFWIILYCHDTKLPSKF